MFCIITFKYIVLNSGTSKTGSALLLTVTIWKSTRVKTTNRQPPKLDDGSKSRYSDTCKQRRVRIIMVKLFVSSVKVMRYADKIGENLNLHLDNIINEDVADNELWRTSFSKKPGNIFCRSLLLILHWIRWCSVYWKGHAWRVFKRIFSTTTW